MSNRYPGGIIKATPTAPTTAAASGIWTMPQATQYIKAGTWPVAPAVPTDAQYNYVTSLLLGNGTNQVANTTVTDSASTPNTITRTGSPRQTSLTPYSQVDGSVLFNGTTDYLAIAQNAAFAPAGDFTIEAWVYFNSLGAYTQFAGNYTTNASTDWLFEVVSDGTLRAYTNGSTPRISSSAGAITTGKWQHIAMVRSSNTISLYLNGVSVGTPYSQSGTFGSASKTIYLATVGSAGYTPLNGFISNFRFVSGTAVYTTTFQPPVGPLTAIANTACLTCQVSTASSNNAFASQGTVTTALTATGNPVQMPVSPFGMLSGAGAQYFDGASAVSTSTLSAIGTDLYTVEFWVNMSSFTGNPIIVDLRDTVPAGDYYQFLTTGQLITSSGLSSSVNATTGQWIHYAIVRSGTGASQTKMYMNGVSVATATVSTNFTSTYVTIGKNGYAASNYVTGYVSNFRIVKGTAIYAGAFKPPFANLTTDNASTAYPSTTNVTTGITASNTKLLLTTADANFATATGTSLNNNTFLDSSPYAFPITRNGTPTQGTFSPYAPAGESWSTYFNASTQYLTMPNSDAIKFGAPSVNANNFTVEMFAYGLDTAVGTLVYTGYSTANYWGFNVNRNGTNGANTAGLINFYLTDSFGLNSAGGIFTANAWHHVAAVRTGTTVSLFVDGVRVATGTSSVDPNPTGALEIAGDPASIGRYFNGYISNLRIIKGSTQPYDATQSTLTVPTAKLTAVTGTTVLTLQDNRFVEIISNPTITVGGTPSIQRFQPFLSSAAYSSSLVGGSGYFNGATSDYIYTPSGKTELNLYNTSWTIEGWVYRTASSANQSIIQQDAYNVRVAFTTANVIEAYIGETGGSAAAVTGTTVVPQNTWCHFVWQYNKAASLHTLYVNGVSQGTCAGYVGSSTSAWYIGDHTAASWFFYGYMSNMRIVKGTALYSGNFIPPTSPEAVTSVPPTAQTSLALNFTNSAIADSGMVGDYTTVADTVTATTVATPFGAGYAMKFDGTGDYLPAAQISPAHDFGTGDFTIEYWFQTANKSAGLSHLSKGGLNWAGADVAGWSVMSTTGSLVYFNIGTTVYNFGDWSSVVSNNTWVYMAFTRSSGNLKCFINGTQFGTTQTGATGDASSTTYGLRVGANFNSTTNTFNGYMSNIRLTKGYARTITASPTATFPTQGQLPASSVNRATYTGSGTWTAPAGVTSANVLVVAGGGSGGAVSGTGGGGGAGGYLYQTSVAVTAGSTYTVIVGAGGASPATAAAGTNGSNSSALGYLTIGGGGGGGAATPYYGLNGGSGGGGAGGNSGTLQGGTATTGQGNAGGSGNNSAPNYGGGGGGGSSAVGGNGSSTTGGAGGAGTLNPITSSGYLAAGGGGGAYAGGTGGAGGSSVGGAGGASSSTAAAGSPGVVNTGSGGGGSGGPNGNYGVGGNGSSGVVIITW